MLEGIALLHTDAALNLQVAALAEGGEVPPAAIRLDAVQVVDGEDAPLGLNELAVAHDDSGRSRKPVWLKFYPRPIGRRAAEACGTAMAASPVTGGPLAGGLTDHVRVAAANTAMAGLRPDQVFHARLALATLMPYDRVTIGAALARLVDAEKVAHTASLLSGICAVSASKLRSAVTASRSSSAESRSCSAFSPLKRTRASFARRALSSSIRRAAFGF